ncbi:uncharacterized protein CCOS01_08478 [Colletotrichum costaricense]|uniref:Uncharacterized protein n=1 Tax=Colletotrichum costaricense TaxID=1209916 RepID=A0AAJ0DZI2_9PEZI|nr:uncharacterized protein CCOS01_08478 [Colletotrichum costaricense]KAK1526060.1 hypothetical protein CCOS01_08478 [Colletotrichum costaricense]
MTKISAQKGPFESKTQAPTDRDHLFAHEHPSADRSGMRNIRCEEKQMDLARNNIVIDLELPGDSASRETRPFRALEEVLLSSLHASHPLYNPAETR